MLEDQNEGEEYSYPLFYSNSFSKVKYDIENIEEDTNDEIIFQRIHPSLYNYLVYSKCVDYDYDIRFNCKTISFDNEYNNLILFEKNKNKYRSGTDEEIAMNFMKYGFTLKQVRQVVSNLAISLKDLWTLVPECWLNDSIVDAFGKYLNKICQQRKTNEYYCYKRAFYNVILGMDDYHPSTHKSGDDSDDEEEEVIPETENDNIPYCYMYSVYTISSLFQYDPKKNTSKNPGYTEKSYNFGLHQFKTNLTGKNIPKYDILLFPINLFDQHWVLFALYTQKKMLVVYDSMFGIYIDSEVKKWKNYMHVMIIAIIEYYVNSMKAFGKDCSVDDFKIFYDPNTPQQPNAYDCGVFVCLMADMISNGFEFKYNDSGDGRKINEEMLQNYRKYILHRIINS